ncbi:hypothetical protein SAMN04488030_2222 [Aliiroseovarius halocynthiae]|uniref:Uncharacterized protein n=1 Tax=Aliiroseovarius halocynthiae TaxID=985055 RepID=A0A545SZS3_9RHOB|nr:hypothetical protein [Aliiroseovarius halocynthiae]TQV70478.1 hypothetical protein FIL88_00825 [Aliiroseovarius halocynthiae]SMR81800.1 hypothetical protein SAMN04488030_2222 [Aliiroseovarius halocynthiae]
MTDFLKDVFDAAQSRIRSPFIGSIVIVFLAINWQPLFNLLFGETPVLDRLAYFSAKTTAQSLYLWPIFGGIAFALASPWLKFAGAWAAKVPTARLKNLQDEEAHQRQIADIRRSTELEEQRAAEEEARERRKIDAAKRVKEAEEAGGEDLVEEVKDDRATAKVNPRLPLLTSEQNQLMIQASQSGTLHLPIEDPAQRNMLAIGDFDQKAYALTSEEAQANKIKRQAADRLVTMRLLKAMEVDGPWRLTDLGREYVQRLAQRDG